MLRNLKFIFSLCFLLLFCISTIQAQNQPKKILIVVQGEYNLKSQATASGRELEQLMGHFNTTTTIVGDKQYQKNDLEKYDYIFYTGFFPKNPVPSIFLEDVLKTDKPVIWMNTGYIEFSKKINLDNKFGFHVSRMDSSISFDIVKADKKTFTRSERITNVIEITNKKIAKVVATTYSTKSRKEIPYIIRANNFLYFADSPFSYADETDRYLYFADMLHDILNEQHTESHSALIRIEDVTPLHDANKLRQIADVLSSRGIPFLVGVVPIYVDPTQGIRVTLSDKPAIVDALKYMVKNGGTIVMHGVTHQYKGISTSDFEFWDESTNAPIKGETEEADSKRIETGIQEFMKNGLYPLLWETPHYTAPIMFYKTISKYFSTAMEQRLSIDDFDCSQYFPYIIRKDIYGQKIYPENLGYVPYDPTNKEISRQAIQQILTGAKYNLSVRDGFASCFFHPFLDIDLLEELVDGIQKLGYTYIDLSETHNWVKTDDRIILSGSQSYTITLHDQYLLEQYFERNGELKEKFTSNDRINGTINKDITLEPGEIYVAEPTEYRQREVSFIQNILNKVMKTYSDYFTKEEKWSDIRAVILWDQFAQGSFFNDEASYVSALKSVNIRPDTIYIDQEVKNLSKYNLVIVPYSFVDSLSESEYDALIQFVKNGGRLITDNKTPLAEEFGIKFGNSNLKVSKVHDLYYPEEEIDWKYSNLAVKFDLNDDDEVFCVDDLTDAPLVIGKKFEQGKIIFLSTLFDPYSQQGYSCYPYFLDYIRRYLELQPVVRRDNLEVYFDPGFRHTFSIENLIKIWASQGIRIIHAAGWHEYPKYTYDYKRLINLAHANGMLVYAWLEPPQVSLKFWTEHPEWREKNYLGEDARPSWRYPIALTDTNCVNAMAQKFKTFLEDYDWDGVNLAELYFEAAKGFNDPKYFTPMHPTAQKFLREKYGIELKSIFNPASEFYWKNNNLAKNVIIDYRVKKIHDVYQILLNQFNEIAKKKDGFQIVVTSMDSYGSPELREYIGVDMSNVIQLQKQYGFYLNVEDPQNLWSTDPRRYKEIGNKYGDLLDGKSKLLLDLNILNFRAKGNVSPFPTLIQTGTEAFQLVSSSALGAPRTVIYAESTVNPQDIMFLPYSLASEVNYNSIENGYEFNSPYSFYLKLPEKIKFIKLNGYNITSTRSNLFLIPAGKSIINFLSESDNAFSTSQIQPSLMSITGNLLSVSYDMRQINFTYESDMRTIVSLNRQPTSIKIDGEDYGFTIMKGNDCFSVFLPTGKHRVELTAGDAFSYGVNLTSLWSSNGIAFFGLAGIFSLVLLYFSIKIIKKKTSVKAV